MVWSRKLGAVFAIGLPFAIVTISEGIGAPCFFAVEHCDTAELEEACCVLSEGEAVQAVECPGEATATCDAAIAQCGDVTEVTEEFCEPLAAANACGGFNALGCSPTRTCL